MASWIADRELTIEGKIAWVTLLVLVFLVPLTFAAPSASAMPFTSDLFDTPKVWLLRVGVMILLAAWGTDVLFNGGRIRIQKPVLILLATLSAVFIASTLVSIEPMQAFLGKYRRYDGSWSFLLYGVLMWVTMQYATTPHRVKQIMQALSLSSVLVAGYGLLQAFGIELFAWGTILFEPNRSFSTFGNPNLLAGFLAFGIFLNLALALSEDETGAKIYYWIATILNVVVSITAFSRSVWVAVFVGLIVFALYLVRLRPPVKSLDRGLAGATVLAAVAFIVASLFNTSYVMNFGKRVVSIFDFSSGSAATRFQIWNAAWRATRERPLLGWGPDTFRMVFRWFQPPQYNRDAGYRSVADNAHNYPLQVAAGIGLIGAVLLYVLQGWILVIAARYAWKRPEVELAGSGKRAKQLASDHERQARNTRIRYVGVLVAALAYLIHLFFGISVPGCTFLLWIAFGILLVPLAEEFEVQRRTLPLTLLGCAVLVFLAALASFYASTLLWADHSFATAQVAQAQERIEEALSAIEVSTRLSPRNDQYAIRKTEYSVEAASRGVIPVDDAVATVARTVEEFPHEYDVYLIALWAYQAMGANIPPLIERGLLLAGEAVARYPEGLALRYSYAELLIDAGRFEEAKEQLEFAVASDPAFIEARDLLQTLSP